MKIPEIMKNKILLHNGSQLSCCRNLQSYKKRQQLKTAKTLKNREKRQSA